MDKLVISLGLWMGGLLSHAAYAQSPGPDTVATFHQNRTRQAKTYLTQAQAHIAENRTAEAQYLLSQAIATQHDLSEAYWLRAALKREADDLAGAIVDCSVVVHQQPERYEARFQRALTQYEAHRYEAARQDFQYLLDHPGGETNVVYFKEDAPPGEVSSEELVTTAVTTLQSDMRSDLLNYVGLCYWHEHDYDQARTSFEQAMNYQPDESASYVNLGITAEATGDTLIAIDYYQQALRRAPGHSVALRNLSSLARQWGDLTLEEKLLSEEESPSYEGLLQQGIFYHRQGKYEVAIQRFTQALALFPQRTEVLVQRGFAYEKAFRTEEALADYTQAIRLDPRSEKAYSNRGNIHFRKERYAQALADYNQAVSLAPANATAQYNRGLTHHRLGNREEACRDLQRAQDLGHRAAAKPLAKICGTP